MRSFGFAQDDRIGHQDDRIGHQDDGFGHQDDGFVVEGDKIGDSGGSAIYL